MVINILSERNFGYKNMTIENHILTKSAET